MSTCAPKFRAAGISSFRFVPRPQLVPDCGIVRPQPDDELYFLQRHFGIRRRLRLPENFPPDGEIPALFPGEVQSDQFAACAAEVVGAVGDILADVDLAVGVGDFEDHVYSVGAWTAVRIPSNNGA